MSTSTPHRDRGYLTPVSGIRARIVAAAILELLCSAGLAANPPHVHPVPEASPESLPPCSASHEAGNQKTVAATECAVSAAPHFPLATKGLPKARRTADIKAQSGTMVDMDLVPVRKQIAGRWVRMLAYNGSVPGPTLRIPQGGTLTIRLHNRGDSATSWHAHGVRLANSFDGVPGLTQASQDIGETAEYQLVFPDPGVYWYHPHVRTDYALASGLYGSIIVTPADASYWAPVNREIPLTLTDIALDPVGERLPFFKGFTDHALMGRFGNVLLSNGETDYRLTVKRGEVVRLYLTNTANARVFNFAIPGVRMKLVGADLGRYQEEAWVDSVLLAPGERRIVDALFDRPGHYPLQHRTPQKAYPLGQVLVLAKPADSSYAKEFSALRTHDLDSADARALAPFFEMEPHKHVKLTLDMSHPPMEPHSHSGHGMHRMPDGTVMHHEVMMHPANKEGIEWEDTMAAMNRATTSDTVTWKMVDATSGQENMAIKTWNFNKGELIKIRLFNDPKSMHPMQHPIHFHGQRFVVLTTNGVRNTHVAWQDTTLVPQGATVDVLLDASNPGKWMAHCHIVEHAESGMMLAFQVK